MGHILTIESDEAFALASELAELRGEDVEAAVTNAIRRQLDAERALKSKVERTMALAAAFRASLTRPLPSSSDMSELYDDQTGLPI